MLIGEIINVALGALRANKLRSLLTMLGIVIGVAAVIAMIALGRGAQQAVNERIQALGTTLLTVMPGQQMRGGFASEADRARLTVRDAEALIERGRYIAAVQPSMQRNFQVQYLNKNTNVRVVGTTSNFLEVRNYKIETGRMFTPAEDQLKQRVAVVGPQVLTNLGVENPESIIGEPIRIRGIQFTVVGVLASKGQGAGFDNPDEQVLIPLQTARYRIFGTDRLNQIGILAPSESQIPLTMADVQKILRREHKLRANRPDDFQIRNQTDFLNNLAETTQVFTFLLAGIAAVSLLVGGIGIMNIMLVSVTERTREIGVRKALGATRTNIMIQFLIEAIVLCLLGGLIGVALGAGAAEFLNRTFRWNTQIAPESVALAFGFSALVGLIFGVWPARRAARLDPVVALRYE
ncbi:MAG TPA: ABC transporter permease [Gemmatimonadaceae bacterium]|jgi:putative ABC transport system permease protein|nr:ABC transporter permease [Gemmatimonadaceae bacterium]